MRRVQLYLGGRSAIARLDSRVKLAILATFFVAAFITESALWVAPLAILLALLIATAGALDVQVTTRPVRMLPSASFVDAVSCAVSPTRNVSSTGVNATEATGVGGSDEEPQARVSVAARKEAASRAPLVETVRCMMVGRVMGGPLDRRLRT